MSLSLTFLGTSASRPTVERGVSSLALVREGETMLIDCGEGTQRQMMRYGVSFNFGDLFFTHFHGDHVIGALGLMRTLSLQGRTETLRIWGPRGLAQLMKRADAFGGERLTYPVEITELTPGEPLKRKDYAIVPYAVDHRGVNAVGYALIEELRRGRFNPDLARELGVPEGPLWGKIHKGEAVTLDDGRVVEPSTLVGPTRTGRRVVLTGDTRPCGATIEMAQGADLLVHESTFGDEEAERAVETGHSTAREAAQVAAGAGVRRLVLTHFSARYSRDPSDLDREAREVFAHVTIARDGMEIEVPFADEPAAS
ncbi:MAG: ribonuclease Z [Gemmatimonadaceae bacterium]|nr:ribonuclease Z [Gemmatimonadaceae bacterium]